MRLSSTLSIYCIGTSEGASKGWDERGRGRKSEDYVYHVTYTDKLNSIKKKGLLPMQTSNWVKRGDQSRYGSGEVYAFENKSDAVRWAAKMDWSFNHQTGSGKISVVKVKKGNVAWDEDNNDPLSQASSDGKWFKFRGKVPAENIVGFTSVTLDHIRDVVAKKEPSLDFKE